MNLIPHGTSTGALIPCRRQNNQQVNACETFALGGIHLSVSADVVLPVAGLRTTMGGLSHIAVRREFER
jgi:hypothetical protein